MMLDPLSEVQEVEPVTAIAEISHAGGMSEVPQAVAAVAVPHDGLLPTAVAIATGSSTIASVTNEAAAAVRMASQLTSTAPPMAEAVGEVLDDEGGVDDGKGSNAKRPWTPDEDALLQEAIAKYGTQRWPLIAGHVQRGRAGKQCRERWFNHLCPSVKKGDWTPEEDKVIQDGVAELGTKWSEIVKRLPGRTDNSIKNRYNSQLRREQRRARAANAGSKGGEPPSADKGEGETSDTPSAKRMRLETEATLAAAAAAVSAAVDVAEVGGVAPGADSLD